jgi:hypothetical protein
MGVQMMGTGYRNRRIVSCAPQCSAYRLEVGMARPARLGPPAGRGHA